MKSKLVDNLKNIFSVYRSSFLWNFIFPLFIGLFLNASSLDFRQLIIFIVWVPILSLPYFIFKRNILLLLPWFGSFFFGILDVINWVTIKAPLSQYSLFVFLETSFKEAKGFLDLKWSFLYFLVPIYIFFSIYLLLKDFKYESKSSKKTIAVLLLFGIIFISENTYKQRFIRKSTPTAIWAVSNFYTEMAEYQNKAENIESFLGKVNSSSLDFENEQVTVVIIGESTTRKRMSLYGYEKETSPLLKNRDDLAIYTDVISPFTHTQSSVRSALTFSNVENNIDYTKVQSLIDLARAANYKTYWISNQASMGVWDNLVALLAKTSENVNFVNDVLNSQLLSETATYDEKLLEPFALALKEKAEKKLIILHLMGTHTTYDKRYPKEFNVFSAKNNSQEAKRQAQYDNAVLYNDFVVNSIIDTLAKYSNLNSSLSNLVYFSDHGENVYDDERQLSGHDWIGIPSNYLVEIPFIVWTSPQYKMQFSALDSVIYSQSNRAFSVDNLFHSALDLMHVKSDLFIDSLSVFNQNYIEKERFVEKQKISYEKEILKGKLLFEQKQK